MQLLSISMILLMFVFLFGLSDDNYNVSNQEVQTEQRVRTIEEAQLISTRLDNTPFGMINVFKDKYPLEFITAHAVTSSADQLLAICNNYGYESDACFIGMIEFEYSVIPEYDLAI